MTDRYQTFTCRLSWPYLKKKNKHDAYSAEFAFNQSELSPTGKQALATLAQACKDKLRETFGDKAFNPDNTVKSGYKTPWRDGTEQYGEGFKFFRAKNPNRPIGLGIAKKGADGKVHIINVESDEQFYPGCYVQAVVTPYTYNAQGNKGVALGLQHVVFFKDGERLDGAAGSASEAFDVGTMDASELEFEEASEEDIETQANVDLLA